MDLSVICSLETCCDENGTGGRQDGNLFTFPTLADYRAYVSANDEKGQSRHMQSHRNMVQMIVDIRKFLAVFLAACGLKINGGLRRHLSLVTSGFEAQRDFQILGSKPHCLMNHWIFTQFSTCKSCRSIAALVRPSSKDLVPLPGPEM